MPAKSTVVWIGGIFHKERRDVNFIDCSPFMLFTSMKVEQARFEARKTAERKN